MSRATLLGENGIIIVGPPEDEKPNNIPKTVHNAPSITPRGPFPDTIQT